jgi:hypothetical protein
LAPPAAAARMPSATGEAPEEEGAALPSANGVHEASRSKTRTEEHRTGNGGGGAGSLMLLTHSPRSRSPPLPLKRQTRTRVVGGLAQEILHPAPAGTRDFVPSRQFRTLVTGMAIDICAEPGLPFYSGRTVTWAPTRERWGPRGRDSGHVLLVTPDGSGAAWGEWRPTGEEAQMRGHDRNFVFVVLGLDVLASVDETTKASRVW